MRVAEYLRDKRISKAKELLANTDSSVGEVGRIVGYTHQSSFARGLPPRMRSYAEAMARVSTAMNPSSLPGESAPGDILASIF